MGTWPQPTPMPKPSGPDPTQPTGPKPQPTPAEKPVDTLGGKGDGKTATFVPDPLPTPPYTLVQAFAHSEGYYDTEEQCKAAGQSFPNRPQRNCNPLDLVYCSESERFGAIKSDGRFAVFPDAATGWLAGRRWLLVPAKFDGEGNLVGGYCGATLRQIINRFAPPNENDSDRYLEDVATLTSIGPDQVVTEEMINSEVGKVYNLLYIVTL